jgi:hypothetical protein
MYNSLVIDYADKTKNICLYLAISMFLIVLFIMTPLNNFILSSFFGKIIILFILAYIIYTNTYYTFKFSNDFNISVINGKWKEGGANILCGYVFSLFTFLLFISILRQFF